MNKPKLINYNAKVAFFKERGVKEGEGEGETME